MIAVNYFTDWAVVILTIVNLGWLLEMIVNAMIQRQPLSAWVKANWKAPLAITTLLACVAIIFIYIPHWGITGYAFSTATLFIQMLFMIDYHKVLKRYIRNSWYLVSSLISVYLSALTTVVMLVFIIATIGVTDF